jgi:non-ribosomal peptide synthetase component F
MSDVFSSSIDLPPEQQAIRAKCFHPTGTFVEFKKEEVEQSIPDRFEGVVARYPDRTAVKTNGCALTYKTLNEAANRIARAILAKHRDKEDPVVILCGKDAPAVAATFGVLKAGKICVVIDPSFPRERIHSMLDDSQARLIVTDSGIIPLAGPFANDVRRLLNIDDVDANLSGENLGLSVLPQALAYIIYTSGSTGEPKGVTRDHRTVLHNAMNLTNACHICADDRATFLGSFSTGQGVTDTRGFPKFASSD